MDQLYEKVCASREEIQRAGQDTTKSTLENMINLYRIVSFVLSVPGSNAFVERIFSPMTIKWLNSARTHLLVVALTGTVQHRADQKCTSNIYEL